MTCSPGNRRQNKREADQARCRHAGSRRWTLTNAPIHLPVRRVCRCLGGGGERGRTLLAPHLPRHGLSMIGSITGGRTTGYPRRGYDVCTSPRIKLVAADIPMGNQEARATRISRKPTSGGSCPPKRERCSVLQELNSNLKGSMWGRDGGGWGPMLSRGKHDGVQGARA